jgi:hypothetical protein
MSSLFDATLALARVLGPVVEGTATGGSATTLVDTTRPEAAEDFYDNGTIWFLSGTNIGKSAAITSWVAATKTLTFATQADAIVAGVKYAVCPYEFSRDALIQAVNDALGQVNRLLLEDTSLLTVENQADYTLPAGVFDLRRVEVARTLVAPLAYQVEQNWREMPGLLRFEEAQAVADFVIRLTYVGRHTALSTDGGLISDYVDMEWVKWTAAVHALRRRLQVLDGDAGVTSMLNEAMARAGAEKMIRQHIMPRIQKDQILARW